MKEKINDRLVSKSDITGLNIRKWNSMGLKPYYFNDNEESDDFGMIPITEIPEKTEDNFKRDIFLLSDSDMEKIGGMVENVKNLVTLSPSLRDASNTVVNLFLCPCSILLYTNI